MKSIYLLLSTLLSISPACAATDNPKEALKVEVTKALSSCAHLKPCMQIADSKNLPDDKKLIMFRACIKENCPIYAPEGLRATHIDNPNFIKD